ncbi:MAG: putative bifunctional diguanylate cyclase/phosphodiesterase [Xanthobacteraceae bacterium]
MLTVLSCLAVEHDLRYVAVAALICMAGSNLSMRLLSRARRNSGARQLHLLFLAGLVAGGTIWTTHFAAMLGYKVPIERAFEPAFTFLSLGIVVAVSLLGFALTTRGKLGPMVEVGGAVFGLGIAAMHYCGMSAFQIPGVVIWDRALVAWSVVLGAAFGVIACNRIARPVTRFCRYGGTLAMVLAIVLTHFTGMAAMTVVPMSGIAIPPQALSDGFMISGVLVAIALIMIMGGSAYTIDLAAAREASDNFQRMAMHDPLTGLPNRHQLTLRLDGLLNRDGDDSARVAVLVIDLDRFKDVNDVHGHGAGDAVLRAIANKVSATLGPQELIARIGGDEFVAVKQDVFARGDAVKFARRLRELILEPVEWQNQKLSVGCSIGIAMFPEHGDDAELIASRADLAMYRAKGLGRGKICTYEPDMDEASRSRAALAIDLKRAVADNQFELHYQAQNDTRTGEIVGFEALLRWNHPERGRVSPAEFIPIAEETGQIIEIGDWVMRTACAAAAKWPRPYRIAVNVATLQLTRGDLPRRVPQILEETGLAPHRLEIELTESGIIADQQHALQVMMALKSIGVTVAMDDFGTGYSSLSTLQNFPFDKIKVDRSFIQSVASNAHSAAIVKATLLLGKSLRIPVLAEGVETEAHLAFLRDEDCPSVQGYLFGQPMPIAEVERMIAQAAMPQAAGAVPVCADAPALAPGQAMPAPAVPAALETAAA